MRLIRSHRGLAILLSGALLFLSSCSTENSSENSTENSAANSADNGTENNSVNSAAREQTDAELQTQIEALIKQQSDLPQGLQITVADGRVMLTGSLECEACGGNATPGTEDTIQQSLGAVVRAVPGVIDLQFSFAAQP